MLPDILTQLRVYSHLVGKLLLKKSRVESFNVFKNT